MLLTFGDKIYRDHISDRGAPCNASTCCKEEELQAWMATEKREPKEGALYCAPIVEEDDKVEG
jgi:hypothetical protein